MKLAQKSWAFICVLTMLLGIAPAIYAQGVQPNQQEVREDFSDDELKKFVSAATKAQEVQQARQQKMISAIEAEDLDVQRFNEIMAAQQGQAQDTEISDEELQAFNLAMQKVMEQQEKLQTEVEETIQKEGISPDTYEEIMLAYQQSPKIQEKVTKLLQEEQ